MSSLQKIVVLCVLGAAAVGFYWYSTQTKEATNTTNSDRATSAETNTPNSDAPANLSGFGSLQELMLRGESLHCTFSSEVDGVTNTGDFYLDGERFRVTAIGTDADGRSFDAAMIYNSERTWTWTTSGDQQFAMTMATKDEEAITVDSATDNQPVSMDQSVTYDCQTWNTDESVFTPPSDIEFTDMDAMMQGMFQGQNR